VRYLLDENLPHRLAQALRERGYDVQHVREVGRAGLSDEQQLAYAAEEERIFVSRDYDDLPGLARLFHAENRPHAGGLLVPRSMANGDIGGIAASITRFETEHPEPMEPYETVWLRPVPH
jgi:hypothetical protein